jgi:hypothetical protein|tara:strand:+ start:87 stop:575 length:489 start_codon:yes stop_codon:yes gene_type:complete
MPQKTTSKKTISVAKKLPPNPFIHEILEAVSKQRTVAKKTELLKEHRSEALTAILIWNFDESVVSMLPEGEVPFNKNEAPIGTDHTSLRKEWRNLYHYVKGGNDSLSKTRRESMFIQLLEGLHPEEAEIICLVKDKNLGTKYKITKSAVEGAYPDIEWGGRS